MVKALQPLNWNLKGEHEHLMPLLTFSSLLSHAQYPRQVLDLVLAVSEIVLGALPPVWVVPEAH
jgi:hypothetical protein